MGHKLMGMQVKWRPMVVKNECDGGGHGDSEGTSRIADTRIKERWTTEFRGMKWRIEDDNKSYYSYKSKGIKTQGTRTVRILVGSGR
jgi:hypothetical protein